jgi:para-aminobenzoate synthetase
MKTLIIDNHDSFTFNLYQLIAEVDCEEPVVVTNDHVTWDELRRLHPDCIVISPGPGHPDNERDFGICRRVLLESNLPILGVCLGHQGIGSAYGARVAHAPEPVHGRVSAISHDGSRLFAGIPQAFEAVRYHSLVVCRPLPPILEETAWNPNGLIMALRHRTKPIFGVQFHPESICTQHGRKLIENFRDLVCRSGKVNHWAAARSSSTAQASAALSTNGNHHGWSVRVRQLGFFPDPESTFLHLFGASETAFWLDSSRVEEGLSRFSFMGGDGGPNAALLRYDIRNRSAVLREHGSERSVDMEFFEFLKSWLNARSVCSADLPFDFNCGLVGYFGYELKAECGGSLRHTDTAPVAALLFADRMIAFDHREHSAFLVHLVRNGDEDVADRWFADTERRILQAPPCYSDLSARSQESIIFRPDQSCEQYLNSVGRCLNYIRDGESYEICLTNQLRAATSVDPLEFYRILRRINPAPYSAFLRFGDLSVACSSPERFLKVQPDAVVESKPIKGTLPRGRSPEEDSFLRERLRTDAKNRAENLMIVDLLRNDLGTVCEIGSVHVPHLMHVESYATVHQLVSTIRGRLKPGLSALDCFRRAFPGGSMTGAPKIRTMELIDQLEPAARGIYSGALGFLGLNGSADLNIVIRTAVFHKREVSIGTGGAIVAQSDPAEEFDETFLKTRALLEAFTIATGSRAGILAGDDAPANALHAACVP